MVAPLIGFVMATVVCALMLKAALLAISLK